MKIPKGQFMNLAIAGEVTLDDLRKMSWWVHRLQDDEIRAANPSSLGQVLFGPFFVVVAVILAIGGQVAVALASAVAGFLLLFPGLISWPGRARYIYGVLPGFYADHPEMFQVRWTIDGHGIEVTDARPAEQRAESRTPWSDYRNYAEDESGYLLYWWPEPEADLEALGDREQIVHYLPRRFFNDEDARVLSEFLRQRFAPRSQP